MGYARLLFPNNATVLTTTVLHDIVGCVTGRFSSSFQLQGANVSGSEIVNTLGQNWNFTYPVSSGFANSVPNNTSGSWVLTAPCVNPTKTKYVRLTSAYMQNNNAGTQLAQTGTGVTNQYNWFNGSTSTAGVLLQTATSASSATTLINPSWYGPVNTGANISFPNIFTGTNIIISWSSRHLVMWSNSAASNSDHTMVMGCIEFPEIEMTIARNLLPVAFIIERLGNLASNIGAYAPFNHNANTYGDILIPEFYNSPTNSVGGTSLGGIFTTFESLCTTMMQIGTKPTVSIPTIDANGANIRQFLPMSVAMLTRGNPFMHLSAFSNMYVVAPGLGNGGDTIQVGGDAYAYLPGSATAFVVKKE